MRGPQLRGPEVGPRDPIGRKTTFKGCSLSMAAGGPDIAAATSGCGNENPGQADLKTKTESV